MNSNPNVFNEFARIINSRDGRLQQLIMYADKMLLRKKIHDRAVTAEDVVNEVVLKIAEGDRRWDPEEEPDLFSFLFMVIKSYVLNLSCEELRYIRPKAAADQDQADLKFLNYIERHSREKPADTQKNYDVRDISISCLIELKNDQECSRVLVELENGLQRKEISEDLNLSLLQVDAAIKRIRRKLTSIIKEYKETE